MNDAARFGSTQCEEMSDDQARVVVGGPTAVEYFRLSYTGLEFSWGASQPGAR